MIGATAMILDGVLVSDDGHFEDLIAKYVGTESAVTFNSGTSALHAVLLAHEK
ncbi:MAG: DegT/DnrJ/EryC1/StrS family aminotransferase [Proteobacteria bacterium]|nr:DegT/DnrJ/EryC1/StrS family aminotransferase [Pseudomonadota bacterium]